MIRVIVHVDMDAFFTSVEQMDHPEYRGKPVVVGADPKGGKGRGVVSAASYEARKFGIHSAMPISRAYRLCPRAVFLPPRFSRYSELSRRVMELLGEFSPLVEELSIDEAFLDCTGTEMLFGPPERLGAGIRERIRAETGLTASVGIASNKSVAKIASDLNKPDGLTICPAGKEREFLAPLPMSRLWGAGKKTVETLQTMGFRIIGDIASYSPGDLEKILGKWGLGLWELARGIDDRPVVTEYGRKSISEETTFEEDVSDGALIERALLGISDGLSRRMRELGIRGRTITLKIRLQGFETFTRGMTLPAAVDDMKTIRGAATELYRNFDRGGKRVRLVGIKLSNLEEAGGDGVQLDLFGGSDPKEISIPAAGKNDPESVLDSLKSRFGESVTRASLLRREGEEKK